MNFEKEFGLKVNTNLAEVVKKVETKKEKTTHIEGALKTQLEMIMKKSKFDYEDLLKPLQNYDTTFFDEGLCQNLL